LPQTSVHTEVVVVEAGQVKELDIEPAPTTNMTLVRKI